MKKTLFSLITLSMILLAIYWGCSGIFYLFFPYQPGDTRNEANRNSFMVGGYCMEEEKPANCFKAMQVSGMNTVAIAVSAHQGRWDENNLWFGDEEKEIIPQIRRAKARGLKVVLTLKLGLEEEFPKNKFLHAGMIYPRTPYLVQRWFEEYTRFVSKWAKIAQEEQVAMLVLADGLDAMFTTWDTQKIPENLQSFLDSTAQNKRQKALLVHSDQLPVSESQSASRWMEDSIFDWETYLKEQERAWQTWATQTAFVDSLDALSKINLRRSVLNWYWERLIYQLRGKYDGKITVAANFENYKKVRFWDKLDCIGINAHFPLRGLEGSVSRQAFARTWNRILKEALVFRVAAGVARHPFLFTELSYSRLSGSTLQPEQALEYGICKTGEKDSLLIWKEQKVAFAERNAAVKGLYQAVKTLRFPLEGILYPNLSQAPYTAKKNPFALQIGRQSRDSLLFYLARFEGLERVLQKEDAVLEN